MTEFKYCVYCEDEPAICFNTEAEAMKFAREDTSMYKEVRVEKTEVNEGGDILNSEVIWSASNVLSDGTIKDEKDNPFETEFPKSDIEDISEIDDEEYEKMYQDYLDRQDVPADWDDPNRFPPKTEDLNIKEAVKNLEEHEDEVECKCCFDLFPKADCVKTEDGYICKKCNQELHSHQGTNLDLIDNDPFSLDYEDPRDPEEPEEAEIKEEPLDANEVRKHEAGIEETLEEHINDRPADIKSDQELQGADNAVVDCEVAKVIAHSEDEKPLDCKMEKPALEEPLAGEEVEVKLNEDLKVIIDFSEYKPWSGAVDTYELIKDADKLDELEAYLEECYPDGITATQINDILWFDSDQVLSYLGLGDAEDEEVDESLKEYWWEDNDPMNWSDKEPLVYSCYYNYELLGYLEYPYMGPEGYPTTIEADIAKYFELPEGYNPEDISWQNVEWEYQLDETKPLIKVDESLKEAVLDENIFSAIKKGFQKLGGKIKKTLYNVFKAKDPHDQMDEYVANVLPNKYYKVETRDRTKGEEWKAEDAKKFTKLDDAIKAAEAHSQNASIDARVAITNEEGTTITLLAYRNKKVIADNLKEFLSKLQSAAEAEGVGGDDVDTVNITFKANGGSGTDVVAKAEKNTKYKLPTAKECKFVAPTGKVFKSWQVNGSELKAGEEFLVNGDIDITANWEDEVVETKKYKFTFKPAEAFGSDKVEEYKEGDTITLKEPADYDFDAPEGKKFKAWNVNGKERKAGLTVPADKDYTIEAIWVDEEVAEEVKHKFTFKAKEDSWPDDDKVKEYNEGEDVVLPTPEELGLELEEGKEFDTWKTEDGKTRAPGKNVKADKDYTFIAVYKEADTEEEVVEEKYTFTFKPEKDSWKDDDKTQEHTKDETVTLPTPEDLGMEIPEGKEFEIWETEDGRTRAAGKSVTADQDYTFIAKWKDKAVAAEEAEAEVEGAESSKTDKLKKAKEGNRKVIDAMKKAGMDISKLYIEKTDKNGRKYKAASPELIALRKELLGESYADVPFDSDAEIGDKVKIIHLEGEDNSYDGAEGTIEHIDDLGQLHGTWGGLAVIPGVDNYEIIHEELNEAKAKPEADKVQSYNNGLKLAKAYGKPVIYGYTNSSYGNKFFELDDPIICDNVSDETKKFRQQYKSCNVVYVAYPSGQLIERLLEELPEGTTEVDYVEYKHSYCHALEPKLEELKKIEDIEELKKAILDIINNDPQVNWTKKEKKFAATVRHKKWKSVKDLKAYLDNSIAKAREIKVSVDADGELVKKLTEEIEFDENGDEIFTPEEQEEFDCDEWGYSNEGYDQFHHCGWCGEIYPESEMRHEVDFGWICSRCEDELKSHGGPLIFIED